MSISYSAVYVANTIVSLKNVDGSIDNYSRHDSDLIPNFDEDGFFIDYNNPTVSLWHLPTIEFPIIWEFDYKKYQLSKSDFGHFTKEMMRVDFSNFNNIVEYELKRWFQNGFDFCSSYLTYDKSNVGNMWQYVTTSGTILLVHEDEYFVFIPNHRVGGTTDSNLQAYSILTDETYESEVATVAKTVSTRRGSKFHKVAYQRSLRCKDRTKMRTNYRNAKNTLLELV
jgi:hypothetical protein